MVNRNDKGQALNKDGSVRKKRYVSAEEKKMRSRKMKEYWKERRRKELMKKGSVEPDMIQASSPRKAKYGHTQDLRKDTIDVVLDYRPWLHQYRLSKALDSGKRFIAFVAGIRSGKSFSGAREALRQIYGTKRKAGLGWIVAPTYDMAKVAMDAFEEAAGAKLILKKRRNEKEYLMRPAKDGDPPYLVQVKTAEHPDRLRGAEVDWVWWDEAAMCDEEVFDILMGRVLTTRGKIWMTTTPQGMTHWLYDQVVKRAEMGEKDYAVIKARTEDNLKITSEDMARLREKYTDEFAAQELEGEFVNFTGLIYKDFNPTAHLFDLAEKGQMPHAEVIGGIDWGYDDPFVFLWIVKEDGVYYVVDEYYRSGEIPRTHLEVVKRNPLQKRVATIYSDISRPESRREFSEGLDCYVLPGRTEKGDLIPGIEYVSALFKQGRLRVANHCRHLIAELGKYSWRKRKDRNSGDTPMDSFNHCLDALRYALYSHRNSGPARSSVPAMGGRVYSVKKDSIKGAPKVVREFVKKKQRARLRIRNA